MKKEEIKQRANEILGEDIIYQGISKLERLIKDKDFIPYVIEELKGEFNDLKKAREKGELDETLKKILIEREAKRHGWDVVGKMEAELAEDGKVCRPHLPRIAEDWKRTFPEVKKAHKEIAYRLEHPDEYPEYGKVEELKGISWIFGREDMKSDFKELFGAESLYSEEDIKNFREKNPEVYKEAQKVGIMVSPSLFEKYLLTGEITENWPKIGGFRISKEEFIERMKNIEVEEVLREKEELTQARGGLEEAFEEPEEEK